MRHQGMNFVAIVVVALAFFSSGCIKPTPILVVPSYTNPTEQPPSEAVVDVEELDHRGQVVRVRKYKAPPSRLCTGVRTHAFPTLGIANQTNCEVVVQIRTSPGCVQFTTPVEVHRPPTPSPTTESDLDDSGQVWEPWIWYRDPDVVLGPNQSVVAYVAQTWSEMRLRIDAFPLDRALCGGRDDYRVTYHPIRVRRPGERNLNLRDFEITSIKPRRD